VHTAFPDGAGGCFIGSGERINSSVRRRKTVQSLRASTESELDDPEPPMVQFNDAMPRWVRCSQLPSRHATNKKIGGSGERDGQP